MVKTLPEISEHAQALVGAMQAPQRRKQAESENTSVELIVLLATDSNLHVRRAAATNPALPRHVRDVFEQLGAQPNLTALRSPTNATATPALEEWVRWVAQLGEWGRVMAAHQPQAPSDLLQELARDSARSVREAIARNPAAPEAVLDGLLFDAVPRIRAQAAQHPHAPQATIAQLIALGSSNDLRTTSPMPQDTTPTPCYDTGSLQRLAEAGPWGAELVARCPSAPAPLLTQLSHHPIRSVRHALADNPRTPSQTLTQLVEDAPESLRTTLAQHPNAPADLLRQLQSSEDFPTRSALAQNLSTPADTLSHLVADGVHRVRAAALENPNTPRKTIAQLIAAGSSPDLTHFGPSDAALNSETLDRLAALGVWGRQLASRHPCTSPQTLWTLANDVNPLIRESVSRHPNRPAQIQHLIAAGSSADLQGFDPPQETLTKPMLHALAQAGSWGARVAARHPSASADLLAQLAEHTDWQVRKETARHNHIPNASLLKLIADVQPDVRWAVLRRKTLAQEVLTQAISDPIATLRIAVAQHPDTPHAVLQRLKLDLDRDVRTAARERLEQSA